MADLAGIIDAVVERLQPLKALGATRSRQGNATTVVHLQSVSEETFRRVSFQSGLIVVSYRESEPGDPIDRGDFWVVPDAHKFSVYLGLKNLENPSDALTVCKVIRDLVCGFTPFGAANRPTLSRQIYLRQISESRVALYELQFEVVANYVVEELAPNEKPILKQVVFLPREKRYAPEELPFPDGSLLEDLNWPGTVEGR
ncbi:MAG: hypothetical protein J7642_21320 [Cyanobacteria bacterium SBC]|nr:hypothetical protein [Cyanobacteria bacterium SBC]